MSKIGLKEIVRSLQIITAIRIVELYKECRAKRVDLEILKRTGPIPKNNKMHLKKYNLSQSKIRKLKLNQLSLQ